MEKEDKSGEHQHQPQSQAQGGEREDPVEAKQRSIVHQTLFKKPTLLPPPTHAPFWGATTTSTRTSTCGPSRRKRKKTKGRERAKNKTNKKDDGDDCEVIDEFGYVDIMEVVKRRCGGLMMEG